MLWENIDSQFRVGVGGGFHGRYMGDHMLCGTDPLQGQSQLYLPTRPGPYRLRLLVAVWRPGVAPGMEKCRLTA